MRLNKYRPEQHEALQWMLADGRAAFSSEIQRPTCIGDMVADWQLAIATVQAVGAVARGPLCARRYGQAVARQPKAAPGNPG